MTHTTDYPSDSYGAPDDGSTYEHPYEPPVNGVRGADDSLDIYHDDGDPAQKAPGEWRYSSSAGPASEAAPNESGAPGWAGDDVDSPVEPEEAEPDLPSAYPPFEFPASTDFMGDPLASFAAPPDGDGREPDVELDAGVAEPARPEPAAVPAPAGGAFFQADTSADLLRWRAEQLLDEMMIGAVDASAGESFEPAAARPHLSAGPVGVLPTPSASGRPAPQQPTGPRVERLSGAPRMPQAGPSGAELPPSTGYPAPLANGYNYAEPDAYGGSAGPAAGNGSAVSGPRLVSVEQRYAPYVRTISPAPPPARPQVTPAAPSPSNGSGGRYANGANGNGTNGHTTNGHTAGGHDAAAAVAPDQTVPPIPQLGPVRRSAVVMTGSVAGAMNVGSTRSKYTSLLPRSAPWDAREMEREIGQLSAVIDRHLPSGYDSSRRARYLLDKAAGILADDPDRSAEVDYYLGQVRAIVERVRQAVAWSNLYRRRLSLYLVGWIVLSAAYLAAGLLFGSQLAEWFVGLLRLNPTGLLANHLVAAFFAGFAGSLGAAVGILAGLGRVGLKHSLVDRKFGLRGLVLPFIGFLVGLLLYASLAGIYWLAGVPASLLNWLTLLPAVLAFLFGLFQEALYGVRD